MEEDKYIYETSGVYSLSNNSKILNILYDLIWNNN